MLFRYGSWRQQIDDNKNCRQITSNFNCHVDTAVRCGAHRLIEHISASLEATGCCHRVSACIALPRQPQWLTNSVENTKTLKHYLINYPHLSDYGQIIFCLSFPSRDRATAPGRYEQFYVTKHVPYPQEKIYFEDAIRSD